MKQTVIARLLLLMPILAACSSSVPSTAVPVPSQALTEAPSATQPAAPAPTNASEWSGIPIMPGATIGEGDEEGYVFTIKATPQQIQEYYERELGKLGWQSSGGETDADSLTLTFMKDGSAALTVNVITKGDEALVILVK